MPEPVVVPRADHPISRRDIDPDALRVLYRLQRSNHVAYLVGGLQDSVLRASWWIPVLTATAASMVGVILYGVVGTVLGEDLIGVDLVKVAVIVGLLNTIAAPVVIRAMRWATGSTRNARARAVYR